MSTISLDVILAEAAASSYARAIRAAVRGLWSGVMDEDQFYDAMYSAVRVGMTGAWNAGAKECGIQPGELSPRERDALQRAISEELSHILGFMDAISEGSKANGGKLKPLISRSEKWANRWRDMVNRAKTMACADAKFRWVVDHAKENCVSCLKLEGKVKRGSYWHSRGILPAVPNAWYLACHGFLCGCELVQTTDRCSPGPLPNLP